MTYNKYPLRMISVFVNIIAQIAKIRKDQITKKDTIQIHCSYPHNFPQIILDLLHKNGECIIFYPNYSAISYLCTNHWFCLCGFSANWCRMELFRSLFDPTFVGADAMPLYDSGLQLIPSPLVSPEVWLFWLPAGLWWRGVES